MEKLNLSELGKELLDPSGFFDSVMGSEDPRLSAPLVALKNSQEMTQEEARFFLEGYARKLGAENPEEGISETEHIYMAIKEIYAKAYESWYLGSDNQGTIRDADNHPGLKFWESVAENLLKSK